MGIHPITTGFDGPQEWIKVDGSTVLQKEYGQWTLKPCTLPTYLTRKIYQELSMQCGGSTTEVIYTLSGILRRDRDQTNNERGS